MEAQDLAYLALMMFASAAVPVTLGVFLKAFFFETLRTRLRDDRHWAVRSRVGIYVVVEVSWKKWSVGVVMIMKAINRVILEVAVLHSM